MSRILKALILVGLLAPGLVLATPHTTGWQLPDIPARCRIDFDLTYLHHECHEGAQVDVHTHGLCCAFNAIHRAVAWITIAGLALVILLATIGGVLILTAAGAPEKISKGKNFIAWALIGLAIILLARALPMIVRILLGVAG